MDCCPFRIQGIIGYMSEALERTEQGLCVWYYTLISIVQSTLVVSKWEKSNFRISQNLFSSPNFELSLFHVKIFVWVELQKIAIPDTCMSIFFSAKVLLLTSKFICSAQWLTSKDSLSQSFESWLTNLTLCRVNWSSILEKGVINKSLFNYGFVMQTS